MSNEVQTEKLDDGTEVVTTTSKTGATAGAGSAATTLPPSPPTPTPLEQTITAVAPTLITNILESFKKIGMPATVAAIVSVVVTVTPFLFKIDERYAKASELEASIERNKEDLAKLTAEVGKVAGSVEVLSEIVGQQYRAIQQMNESQARSVREPVRPAVAPPVARPAPMVAAAPIVAAPAPIFLAPTENLEDASDIELDPSSDVTKSLDEIRRSLEQSRKNLDSIQKDEE